MRTVQRYTGGAGLLKTLGRAVGMKQLLGEKISNHAGILKAAGGVQLNEIPERELQADAAGPQQIVDHGKV